MLAAVTAQPTHRGPADGPPRRPATEAEARALASAVRLRILRLCLDEALTNKEIARRLARNPGSVLHHVRRLVETGFLAPEPERRGMRGAREVPYRATRKSWTLDVGERGAIVQAFLDEVRPVENDEETLMVRLGVRLTGAERGELLDRLSAIFEEYARRPASPSGTPYSLFFAFHRDTR
ncbi:MAG: helix-turn-helix domain-containing protein [Streptosporangiales bacterium]|nr:helix-turn-helix domain-containing protein [Streptosporangiales bacterium]